LSEYDKKEESKMSAQEKRSFGAVLGAFVGDALGAYLEFKGRVSKKELEECLEMNGGGSMGTGKGQVTDDSEMAMCLLQALGRPSGGEFKEDIVNIEDASVANEDI
jgi:ADP-ribosylglycohydrolase